MASDHLDDVYVPEMLSDEDRDYFEKSGFGNRQGFGETPALIVVDMTEEFTSDEYDLGRSDTGNAAIDAISSLLEVSRDVGLPIYYTKPDGDHPAKYQGVWAEKKFSSPPETRPGNDIAPALAPRDDEVVIEKGKPSAFFGTHLADMLRYEGVDTVIVTGMVTSGCIRATVVDACSHNFKATVPIEAVADRSTLSHEVNLFEMDLKYGDVTPVETVIERLEALAAPVTAD